MKTYIFKTKFIKIDKKIINLNDVIESFTNQKYNEIYNSINKILALIDNLKSQNKNFNLYILFKLNNVNNAYTLYLIEYINDELYISRHIKFKINSTNLNQLNELSLVSYDYITLKNSYPTKKLINLKSNVKLLLSKFTQLKINLTVQFNEYFEIFWMEYKTNYDMDYKIHYNNISRKLKQLNLINS